MASVTDIGAVTNPLGGPLFGGPLGWAAAVRDALNSSDVTVDARIAAHAGAADPHPGYLTPSEGNGLYEALGAVSTHAAASDPHTGYQREVEKAAANGYASLDASTKVPYAQLPTGTAASTVAIGDHTHAAYVDKGGSTMTGALTLPGDPTAALHAAPKQYVDNSMPLGAIIMFGGNTAPTGWHLCDGTAHGSTALQTLIGSANTPDLRGKFIVGVGDSPDASTPTVYARGDKGGAESVTLSAAESGVPAHNHPASGSETTAGAHSHGGGTNTTDVNHTHSGTTDAFNVDHVHNASVKTGTGGSVAGGWDGNANETWRIAGAGYWYENNTSGAVSGTLNHGHSFQTGWMNHSNPHSHVINSDGGHTHPLTITTSNNTAAAAASAHENRPPYYALTYIIKKV